MGTPIRQQFRALTDTPLVYLDAAATSLMPHSVIQEVAEAMSGGSAHRSVHPLARRSTERYAQARARVARCLGAEPEEIVFVRSATEGLNALARSWAGAHLRYGDEVCVSTLEHHSNLLPWRRVCEQVGATLVNVGCTTSGEIDLDDLKRKLGSRTRIVAVTHVSNVTGAVTPMEQLEAIVRARSSAALVVDGAQAVAHLDVNLSKLGADFYVFSAHKTYGPQGVGAVWAHPKRWAEARPDLLGGGAVLNVAENGVELADGAARFEAGTPNVAGAIGAAAGLEFVRRVRSDGHELISYAEEQLRGLAGIRVLGRAERRVGAISFVIEGVHAHDVASMLCGHNVAVRVGHLCAQPLMQHFGVRAAVRASLGVYSTRADIDALILALDRTRSTFQRGQSS